MTTAQRAAGQDAGEGRHRGAVVRARVRCSRILSRQCDARGFCIRQLLVATSLPDSTRAALERMGYKLEFTQRTSGPINAILFDAKHHSMWGGSSNHGEDYGIAW